jgi:hypothetical protein
MTEREEDWSLSLWNIHQQVLYSEILKVITQAVLLKK